MKLLVSMQRRVSARLLASSRKGSKIYSNSEKHNVFGTIAPSPDAPSYLRRERLPNLQMYKPNVIPNAKSAMTEILRPFGVRHFPENRQCLGASNT